MKIKVIIAGGRDFNNYTVLKSKMDYFLQNTPPQDIEIVVGGARGADKLGEDYAEDHDLDYLVFEADWDKYGKSAGYIRNKQMAEYATHLVAFWDGESKGTQHMIDLAKDKGLVVRVVNYHKRGSK